MICAAYYTVADGDRGRAWRRVERMVYIAYYITYSITGIGVTLEVKEVVRSNRRHRAVVSAGTGYQYSARGTNDFHPTARESVCNTHPDPAGEDAGVEIRHGQRLFTAWRPVKARATSGFQVS